MPESQEMLFSDYLHVLRKRRWLVIISALAVWAAAGVWASRKQPVFESSATIKIQRVFTFAEMLDEIIVPSADPIDNYVREITGLGVLERAASAVSSGGAPCASRDLRGAVSVKRVERTDLIAVTSRGSSPSESKVRCEAVLNAFIAHHDENISRTARDVAEHIEKSLKEKTGSLAALEKEFREQLGGDNALPELLSEELKVLREKLVQARLQLQILRSKENYTEEYPEIAAWRGQVQAIERQIRELTEKQVAAQRSVRDYEQRRKITEEMSAFLLKRQEEAKIAGTRKPEQVSVVDPPADGDPVVVGQVRMTVASVLLGLMLGIVLAFVAENMDTSIRTIGEIEKTFGLRVLGIIPHFSPQSLDVPIRPEGILERLKYSRPVTSLVTFWRVACSVVSLRRRGAYPPKTDNLIVPFFPRSPATEGYRAIRTSLQLASGEGRVGAILLTSAGPAEGKTTTCANLAMAFAQAGKKVVLVGANMRRPSLHMILGLKRDRGLSDILIGELSWRDAVKDHRDVALGDKAGGKLATAPGMENLFVITSGARTIHPAEWLALPSLGNLVKELSAEFDVVLVDGPPLLPVPDSVIISAAVRRVVLVYQVGVTPRDSMRRAISLVQDAGAEIAGLVINDLSANWAVSSDFVHYRGYYGRPEK